MFSDRAIESPWKRAPTSEDSLDGGPPQYHLADRAYGKDGIRIMHVTRHGLRHSVTEFEVSTRLKLLSDKDYLHGDNSDIVATDSQKNTVYLLAKKHGIENAEKFALLLGRHFLDQYSHVTEAHIHVAEAPWQRIIEEGGGEPSRERADHPPFTAATTNRRPHNHAFEFAPIAQHYCDVWVRRNGTARGETVISGLKGLRLLKTTQSSFVNFVRDEYRSLPDQHDRIFSTDVDASWQYSASDGEGKFGEACQTVKDIILRNFAGDPVVGVSSPSVQNTIYLIEKEVLKALPQVSVISMSMRNKHCFNFDTSPFHQLVPGENNDVFIPVDKPHGIIYAQLARKDLKSHL